MGEEEEDIRDKINSKDSGSRAYQVGGPDNETIEMVLDHIEDEVARLEEEIEELDRSVKGVEKEGVNLVSYGIERESENTYLNICLRLGEGFADD